MWSLGCIAAMTWFLRDVGQDGKNVHCVFSCHGPRDRIGFFMLYLFMARTDPGITKMSEVLGSPDLKARESW